MTDTTTIAHLSDVHLSPVEGFSPRYWNAKRALGFVNWQRKRRHVHQRAVVERIVADIARHAPDHIAISGDLVNIGLPTEYHAAAEWLATVGPPHRVSVVPGNHDIYTTLRGDIGTGRWSAYMASDDWGRALAGLDAPPFPYVRRVGRVAILGLCSAVETAPAIATGRLGPDQMRRAAALLERIATEPLLRLVMIHHPPLPGATRPRHGLLDAGEAAAMLTSSCADIVLHGHTHLPTLTRIPRADRRPLFMIGVASASAGLPKGHEPLAQYNLLRIGGPPAAPHVTLERRGMKAADGPIVEIERIDLA